MSEEEVLAGTPAGQGGRQTDVWDAVDWMPPPPPAWWPQTFYTYEPPPPPRRTSRLRMLLVALVLVIFGASAAATAVIATRGRTGRPVKRLTSAVTIAMPAEGPSFGIAPDGT